MAYLESSWKAIFDVFPNFFTWSGGGEGVSENNEKVKGISEEKYHH